MKTIVIYRSKTGFTQRYAQWIAEALGCEALPWKTAAARDLSAYDTIIYGAPFHAGMILGVKKFLALPAAAQKRRIVFVTGASPAQAPDVEKSLRQNFTQEQWEAVQTFYFQSGLNYERMGRLERGMMAIFRAMVKKQEGKDSMTYRMVSASYDLSDKAAIAPLVEACKGL